ncbi:MAG: hypothetical protein JSR91_06230 [Proteobacteria bacterium]|nr:hypothetical protein [Pseudomonadota bacterium]
MVPPVGSRVVAFLGLAVAIVTMMSIHFIGFEYFHGNDRIVERLVTSVFR